jgi:hypothetical protein
MTNKALATASGSDSSTAVSVSASLVIAGTAVAVTSQDINKITEKGGFQFELAHEINLGSINDLLDWIKDTFFKDNASFDPSAITETLKALPVVGPTLTALMEATFEVRAFKMDTGASTFEIAILVTAANNGISFLNDAIVLKDIGIGVDYAGSSA